MKNFKCNYATRPSEFVDVNIVAWTVLTALDMDSENMDKVIESCSDEKSMYSWRNSIVACDGDEAIGCIVCYAGDKYETLRQYTWGNLWRDIDEDFIKNTPAETHPGEFYLDSMAIRPEYRGKGIGELLIEAAISKGRELGYKKFSLLVDVEKPRLKTYYETIGFCESGKMMFFGHQYDIMRYVEKD